MTYFGNKRGEVKELERNLADFNVDVKLTALRNIIFAMTLGKDVSMLFMAVLKNMETQNIELKKLVYLYVMNYARSHPDKAIMGINTFRKDSRERTNPLLRALAIRTMGCIKIEQIVEYLIDPLKEALRDEDSYVRKTAVLCAAKMYEINPAVIEQQGFLKVIENLLTDGNAMVVSNAVAALQQIAEGRGTYAIDLKPYTVQKLLTAINECNEWGQTVIIDSLSNYIPADPKETEDILDRVSSRLSHSNPGVVIATVRLSIRYLDYLTNPDSIRKYTKKLGAPLVSLLSSESEVVYVALKSINIILQKRPNVLEKELKMFFCQYSDPIYIKLEKLDILVKLGDMKNIDLILHELKEYGNEVDVEFVRKSIRTIGRLAIKLDGAAERCAQALWELLKSRVSYVVQECVVVIKDLFRKYPGKFEAILKDLCDNLKILEEPEAKASMVWIVGQYVEIIENADQILYEFIKGFKDEASVVQLQVLTSCVKLYLTRPSDGQEMVMEVLKIATTECENPDLRDRAYIYWRLMAKDMNVAKAVILAEKPPISDTSYTLDSALLDKLVENIGTLASVYGKPPEQFVKKLRESQNLKELEDEDDDAYETNEDSSGQKIGSYQSQAINQGYEAASQDIDLLGMSDDVPSTQAQSTFSTTSTSPTKTVSNAKNIKIPYSESLAPSTASPEKKITGIKIEAAIQREDNNVFLDLRITNQSQGPLSDFAVKFNSNTFKIQPASPEVPIAKVDPGQTKEGRVPLNFEGPTNNTPPGFPFKVQVALKTNVDILIFFVPCSLSVLLLKEPAVSTSEYQELSTKGYPKTQNSLKTTLSKDQIKTKFNDNSVMYVASRTNNAGVEMMSYSAKIVNGMTVTFDAILDESSGNLQMSYSAPYDSILPLFYQAIGFILNM